MTSQQEITTENINQINKQNHLGNTFSCLSPTGVNETNKTTSVCDTILEDPFINLLMKKRKNSVIDYSANRDDSPKNKNITSYFKQKKNLMDLFSNKGKDAFNQTEKDEKIDFFEEKKNKSNKLIFNGTLNLSSKTHDLISKLNTKQSDFHNFIGLSEKTKSLLESIKKKDGNILNYCLYNDYSDVLNAPSMRDKYEGLLMRELLLPVKYKEILNKFILLDEAIDFLKNKRKCRSFPNIQNYIKTQHKKEIKADDFSRILFVGPHLFIYKWEKIQNDYELIIDIPSNISQRLIQDFDCNTNFQHLQTNQFTVLENSLTEIMKIKREEIFKDCLINITLQHHQKFIKDKKIKTKLNPMKHKTWHHDFDVHSCPEINTFPIQQKPKKITKIF